MEPVTTRMLSTVRPNPQKSFALRPFAAALNKRGKNHQIRGLASRLCPCGRGSRHCRALFAEKLIFRGNSFARQASASLAIVDVSTEETFGVHSAPPGQMTKLFTQPFTQPWRPIALLGTMDQQGH